MQKKKNKLTHKPSIDPITSTAVMLCTGPGNKMHNIVKLLLTLGIFAAASLIFYYIFIVIHSTYMRQNERLSTSVERIIEHSLEHNTKQIVEFLSLNTRLTEQNPRTIVQKATHYEMLKAMDEAIADLRRGVFDLQNIALLRTLKDSRIEEELTHLTSNLEAGTLLMTDEEIYSDLKMNFTLKVVVLSHEVQQEGSAPASKKLSFKDRLKSMITIEPRSQGAGTAAQSSRVDLIKMLLERQEYEMLYSLLAGAPHNAALGSRGLAALAQKADYIRAQRAIKEIVANTSMVQND